jgi:hypothetical protein
MIGNHGVCKSCGKASWLLPLHGEEGGPLCCPFCIGKWDAEHGRRRKLGRIVIRAIRAFLDDGGKLDDIDKLKVSAISGGLGLGLDLDPLGYLAGIAATRGETIELTSELLNDTLQLTHPDRHSSEHKELANRVTAELLVLKPFVFPKPQPKPESLWSKPRDGFVKSEREYLKQPSRAYPCPLCADTTPYFIATSARPNMTSARKRNPIARERNSASGIGAGASVSSIIDRCIA